MYFNFPDNGGSIKYYYYYDPAVNGKPLTLDQACWNLNEKFHYEEYEYRILIQIEASTRHVDQD